MPRLSFGGVTCCPCFEIAVARSSAVHVPGGNSRSKSSRGDRMRRAKAFVAAGLSATVLVLSVSSADARWGHRGFYGHGGFHGGGGYYGRGYYGGGPGLVGGVVVGALTLATLPLAILSSAVGPGRGAAQGYDRPNYGPSPYAYGPPPPRGYDQPYGPPQQQGYSQQYEPRGYYEQYGPPPQQQGYNEQYGPRSGYSGDYGPPPGYYGRN
jgi:hypothetical protein